MTEAIEQYTQALQRARRSPETSPKERARIYQKLTQASLKSSNLAPRPKKQTAHAEAAREYAQAALQAAKESEDDCMAAQVEFLLACVALWLLRLQSDGERSEEVVSKAKDELQICTERLKRHPEVQIRVYEEQMRAYLAYFAEDS